ncbi:MAG: hypothetical protein NUV69_01410 [Candidatus Curtissbacteria bacterium]|nr:hypothetical protein [Candidatus Curtissbacteria bacterium]
MFFGGGRFIVYVRSNAIVLGVKGMSDQSLPLGADVVKNLDVLDPDKFAKLVGDFFGKYKLKGKKAVIVIGADLVFEKIIVSSADDLVAAEKFFNEVPTDAKNISKKIIKEGKNVRLVAVNGGFFTPVVASLRSLGAESEVVLPATVLGLGNEAVGAGDIGKITSNKMAMSSANFLDRGKEEKPKKEELLKPVEAGNKEGEIESLRKNQLVLLALGVILVLGAGLLFAYAFGFFS